MIGYREFEAKVLEGSEEEPRWLNGLTDLLDGIDVSGADRYDARVQQLQSTMVATTQMIIALYDTVQHRSGISDATYKLAKQSTDRLLL